MVIISAGMPKSGSAYIYNLINELNIEAGNVDAREIKNKYGLETLMKWHNNNIGSLSLQKLLRLWRISSNEGAFVVKTHNPPNIVAKALSRLGMIRIIYCFRDPRDVILSMIDHGKAILAGGEKHTFAAMVEFDDALQAVRRFLKVWKRYNEMNGVLMVKYETLMDDPIEEMKRIENFLGISIGVMKLEKILWKYSKDNSEGDRAGMHFNKAKTLRFREEMTIEEKIKCNESFGDYIEWMGYSLE